MFSFNNIVETPENLSVSNCSVVILVTKTYMGRSCTSLAPLISDTSEDNFIKKTPNFHSTEKGLHPI